MHDLRKKVLVQSGKTRSRKALAREDLRLGSSESADPSVSPKRSPRASPGSSRAGSRANSRPGSRYASEDEAESDEASTGFGDVSDSEDDDLQETDWKGRLRARIAQLQDMRKSNVSERQFTVGSYLHLIRYHNARAHIEGQIGGTILPGLIASIERGKSPKEIISALHALSVTLITCPFETAYERASKALERVVEYSEDEKVKATAINTLAVTLVFGGGMQPDIENVLEFLLSIVESDGQSVGADDNGIVVASALRSWGCAASYLVNLGESTEDGRAMEAFLDQLDSTEADVQISAGYNIAQLFEAARNLEKRSGVDGGLQRNQHLALTRMKEIVRHWTKSTAKKERRLLRDEFPSIIISIEKGVGPGYSSHGHTAVSDEHDHETGNFIDYVIEPRIKDTWVDSWKAHSRLEVLRVPLLGGLECHWRENQEVQTALQRQDPEAVEQSSDSDEEE